MDWARQRVLIYRGVAAERRVADADGCRCVVDTDRQVEQRAVGARQVKDRAAGQ
jgi:hypothetical protein